MDTQAQARAEVDKNLPELKQGQIWTKIDRYSFNSYPNRIRIVCRYPFARPEDGRLWIIDSPRYITYIDRIPELTLRQIYRLETDV